MIEFLPRSVVYIRKFNHNSGRKSKHSRSYDQLGLAQQKGIRVDCALASSRQADEYLSSNGQRQPSAGIYSVSRNEKGEAVVSFNPSQMDKDASKKNSPEDKRL
ncbi:hypothetical protein [Paenibacillus sp. HW567]|uniref:hypothetical protein n=1 Tax=Paenibacillus sp. HW567 TaxID=1034769 RepID=UPI00036D7396|nr:hypothetical protein [Paenibacillus sp. HW567]